MSNDEGSPNGQNDEVYCFHRDGKVDRLLLKTMPNNCAFGAWNYHRLEDKAIHP